MSFVFQNEWIGFRNLRINTNTKTVFVDDGEVSLTKTEFKVLNFLISSQKRIYTLEELVLGTWGPVVVTNKTINTHLSHIRAKIKGVDFKIKINRNGQVCINDL
ncbi:winged helix-turn-helix domain-containing protein [Halobacteriovorax sp. XZX-3]|uniref:winged helix-turn-helix domain-containing protein n=1 Tax=unclassified Halobacteriovorax TaxID=2639665 RepID=UPI001304ADDD|nr:winged helix-turn-helix domain-containing protein [Halobacteriovorax sp. DA5]